MIKPGIKVLLLLVYFSGAHAFHYRPQLSVSLSNSPVQVSRILDSGRGYESEKEDYSLARARAQLSQVKVTITKMIQAQETGQSKQFERYREESQKLLNTMSGGLSKLAASEIPQIFEELRKERARYNSFCVSPKWQVTASQKPSHRLSLTKPHKPLVASRDQKYSRSESKLDLADPDAKTEKIAELIIAPTGHSRPKIKPPVPLFSDMQVFTPIAVQKGREPEKAKPVVAAASAAASESGAQHRKDSPNLPAVAAVISPKTEVAQVDSPPVNSVPAATPKLATAKSANNLTKNLIAYACVTGFVAWLIHKVYFSEELHRGEQLRVDRNKQN